MLSNWNENSPNVLNQIFSDIDDIRTKLNTLRGVFLNMRGVIVMWSGLLSQIPEGWVLCNGQNGTPDLRDKFIVGAGREYTIGNTGGAKEVTLTASQLPSHNHTADYAGAHSHTGSTNVSGSHTHTYQRVRDDSTNSGMGGSGAFRYSPTVESTTSSAGNHSHSVSISSVGNHTHTINNTGGGQAHENRPPYYALAFIMYIGGVE